jgi:hypothetical protein
MGVFKIDGSIGNEFNCLSAASLLKIIAFILKFSVLYLRMGRRSGALGIFAKLNMLF